MSLSKLLQKPHVECLFHVQFKSCSFPSSCPEHQGGTEPKRDAQMKPCLSGNQQRLCHRAGRCWISWLCFWGLKTIAEVCSETRRSLSPLLPPSFLLPAPPGCWTLSPWSWTPTGSPLPGLGTAAGATLAPSIPPRPNPGCAVAPQHPEPCWWPPAQGSGSPPKPIYSLL